MISVDIDVRSLVWQLDDMQRAQFPFAVSKAINDTAFAFQDDMRKHLGASFTLRRRTFIEQGVYFPRNQRADKRKLEATVSLEPKRGFMAKFEKGGLKLPTLGGSRLAIPRDVKRSKSDVVTAANRPKALNLVRWGRTIKASVSKGDRRTFSIRYPDGRGLILQRKGKGGGSSLRVLYTFRRSVPIPASLAWQDTAERTVRAEFPTAFARAFEYAMSTARK